MTLILQPMNSDKFKIVKITLHSWRKCRLNFRVNILQYKIYLLFKSVIFKLHVRKKYSNVELYLFLKNIIFNDLLVWKSFKIMYFNRLTFFSLKSLNCCSSNLRMDIKSFTNDWTLVVLATETQCDISSQYSVIHSQILRYKI